MFDEASVPPSRIPIFESVRLRKSNVASLVSESYGKGLQYLIRRRCPDHAAAYYTAVIEACVASLERGEVTTEGEIPALLQSLFQTVAHQFPNRVELPEIGQEEEALETELRRRLSLFSPTEQEALRRFYVEAESPSSICEALGLSCEQFSLMRQVARWMTHISRVMNRSGLSRIAPKPVLSLRERQG